MGMNGDVDAGISDCLPDISAWLRLGAIGGEV